MTTDTPPFKSVADIEDVRVILMVKGKHYSIIPNGDKEEARMIRVAIAGLLLSSHNVVTPSIEEINSQK